MKKIITLILFIFLVQAGNSQTKAQIDSINFIVNNASNDSIAIKELFAWDDKIYLKDLELDRTIIFKIEEITSEYLKKPKSKFYLFMLRTLGEVNNIIAQFYKSDGDVHEALEYYYKAIKVQNNIYETTGELIDKRPIGQVYSGIGTLYVNINETDSALSYFNRALKIAIQTDDKVEESNVYANKAYIYSNQIKDAPLSQKDSLFKISYQLNRKGLAIRKSMSNTVGVTQSLNNIGVSFERIGQMDSAKTYYLLSLNLSRNSDYLIGKSFSYGNIAAIEMSLGDTVLANKYADSAYQIAKDVDLASELAQPSRLLYKIQKSKGNWKAALTYLEEYFEAEKTLRNEENNKSIYQAEAKFKFEKREAVLKEREKLNKAEIKNQQTQLEIIKQQRIFYIVGIVFIIIFLVYVFWKWRESRKKSKVIQEQKMIVDKAYHILEEKNTEIMDSITYAQRIQSAIMPPVKMVKEALPKSFVLYKPKDIVAGDFYWMEQIDDAILIAAADCTGHGVPGAMVSVVCNNGLNRSVREHGLKEPAKILDKTREIVIAEFEKSEEDVKDGMDIALISLKKSAQSEFERESVGHLEPVERSYSTLSYAGAHNPLWIIRKDAEEVEEIKADKQPIGKFGAEQPFTNHTIDLQKGDTIYVFSDGFADQFGGEKGKKYKSKNFKKLLLSVQNETMERQRQLIDEAFEEWKRDLEQLDDVCVIGVKI